MLELRRVAPGEWELVYPRAYFELRGDLDQAAELIEAGDHSGAEAILRTILARAPWCLDAQYHLAGLLESHGRAEEAMERWRLAVQTGRSAYPDRFEVGQQGLPWSRQSNRGLLRCLRGWGLALAALGRSAAALEALRELLLLDPGDPLTVRGAAIGTALELDRTQDALELAQTWEQGEPAEVSYGRALALFGMSEEGKATHALQLAIVAAPHYAADLLAPPPKAPRGWPQRWRRYPGALEWLQRELNRTGPAGGPRRGRSSTRE